MLKNLPAKAGDAVNLGMILELRRSYRVEMATHSSILDGKTPLTEESVREGRVKCD